jgi:DNA polymerase III alpha subunit
MPQDLKPIELIDHLLWPDGIIQVTPEKLIDFTFKLAAKGKVDCLSVTELTPEIKQFNSFGEHQLSVKTSVDTSIFPPEWILPEKYLTMDLDAYLYNLYERIEKDSLFEKRLERLAKEIFEFKQHGLEEVLRLLIFIVDRLIETNSIWGVGRGSSCSSYLLFLIGLHEIDPVLYEINLSDFLRN